MSKLSAEALVKLQELVDSGKIINIDKNYFGYEITVFYRVVADPANGKSHSHYQGKSLAEAILSIKE